MQAKYGEDNLHVILFSTDTTKDSYHKGAPALFEKYGGGQWPSVVLPNGFRSALRFGNFGYGKVIVGKAGLASAG